MKFKEALEDEIELLDISNSLTVDHIENKIEQMLIASYTRILENLDAE